MIRSPRVLLTDGAGREVECVDADGYILPMAYEELMKEDGGVSSYMEKIKRMELRADDIMICTYLKSGTHWLWEIVSMLVNGKAEHDKTRSLESHCISFASVSKLSSLPSPRLLHSHFPVERLPKKLFEERKRIVRISRNPKDLVVSLWAMYTKHPVWKYTGTFADFLPLFLGHQGKYFIYSWFQYELEWERFMRENPDYPILSIFYEDLKEDTAGKITKIGRFFEIPCDANFANAIATKCEFQSLRHSACMAETKSKWGFLFRKGEVGDWKNWFTVSQSEAFDEIFGREMKDSKLSFRYEL